MVGQLQVSTVAAWLEKPRQVSHAPEMLRMPPCLRAHTLSSIAHDHKPVGCLPLERWASHSLPLVCMVLELRLAQVHAQAKALVATQPECTPESVAAAVGHDCPQFLQWLQQIGHLELPHGNLQFPIPQPVASDMCSSMMRRPLSSASVVPSSQAS